MTDLIPLSEHPSNRDRTAKIVVELRREDGCDLIWSMREGFVATLAGPAGLTFPGHFATATAALDAITQHRAGGAS